MRIIAVDDDHASLRLLEKRLKNLGHDVITANSGEEALERLDRSDARAVVCDWDMPGMTGPDVARRIRAAGYDRYVYVMLLTAHSGKEALVEGLRAGADEFLTKPVDPAELEVRLKTAQRVASLESRDRTIFAMARLAESRDPETGAHLERVRSYCRTLSLELKNHPDFKDTVTDEFVRLMYLTSPLHDIGKVAIPDCVLLKVGRLDDQDWAVMKTHAALGAETLANIAREYPEADFLFMARDIALTHHEQWSGGGYPRGLKGEEIPLSGRIMAVADVYDALRSKRVYKDACTHHVARSIIREGAGKHFDPRLVDAFDKVEREFDNTARRFSDHTTPVALRQAA